MLREYFCKNLVPTFFSVQEFSFVSVLSAGWQPDRRRSSRRSTSSPTGTSPPWSWAWARVRLVLTLDALKQSSVTNNLHLPSSNPNNSPNPNNSQNPNNSRHNVDLLGRLHVLGLVRSGRLRIRCSTHCLQGYKDDYNNHSKLR